MVRWSAWKSVVAGVVIGFVEAAGSDAARRRLRRPPPVVWIDRRRAPNPLARLGVRLLDPLPLPPRSADRRRPIRDGILRITRIRPRPRPER